MSGTFALLVGIDEYAQGDHGQRPAELFGCKKDVENFACYLIRTFDPKPDNHQKECHRCKDKTFHPDPRRELRIVKLCDKEASRAAILNAFETHFIKNRAIKKNDAMIFYFAGHGSRVAAKAGWHSEDKMVEVLCPYDVVIEKGIPDYTISALLRKVAQYKGDNITAILDCCYSGGMGRIDKDVLKRARCYRPREFPILLPELDHDIWSWVPPNSESSRTGSKHGDPMDSFVLLAACQPHELALETSSGGSFTTVLLDTLRSCNLSAAPPTYVRLLESLSPLPSQNPHCEGKNRVRRFLMPPNNERDDDPAAFVVTREGALGSFLMPPNNERDDDPAAFVVTREGGQYYVGAGHIHGVLERTEFTTKPPLGYTPVTLMAKAVEPFRCLVERLPPNSSDSILPHHSRAVISKQNANWLKIKLTPRNMFPPAFDDSSLFSVVDAGADADALLEVHYNGPSSKARLVRKDVLMKSLDLFQPVSLAVKEITTGYLNRVAHFNFFLYHQSQSAMDKSSITVSLQPLRSGQDPKQPLTYLPVGENLFKAVEGDTASGAAKLMHGEDYYGLTLVNHTETDLFPYVFYFNPFTYSIKSMYLPHSPISPPLRHRDHMGSKVTIGYGAHGTEAFRFRLLDGVNVDSGFIKVFVSRSYVNMKAIEIRPGGRLEMETRKLSEDEPLWGAWTYIITVEDVINLSSSDTIVFNGGPNTTPPSSTIPMTGTLASTTNCTSTTSSGTFSSTYVSQTTTTSPTETTPFPVTANTAAGGDATNTTPHNTFSSRAIAGIILGTIISLLFFVVL